jgi:hypothetical protein
MGDIDLAKSVVSECTSDVESLGIAPTVLVN